jgi:hypothetical protein
VNLKKTTSKENQLGSPERRIGKISELRKSGSPYLTMHTSQTKTQNIKLR